MAMVRLLVILDSMVGLPGNRYCKVYLMADLLLIPDWILFLIPDLAFDLQVKPSGFNAESQMLFEWHGFGSAYIFCRSGSGSRILI